MWTVLAAIPAGPVVAVTAAILVDLAAARFLWVLPLSLYLLTFVAIFRDRPWVAHERVLHLVPFAAVAVIANASSVARPYLGALLVMHLAGFYVIGLAWLGLACHGELYRRRPAPARLMEFYLWTSFGGVNRRNFHRADRAAHLQRRRRIPCPCAGALLAMPGAFAGGTGRFLRRSGPGLVSAAAIIWLRLRIPADAVLPIQIALISLAGALMLMRRQPALFFGLAVLAFVIAKLDPLLSPIVQVRSFFGVHRVVEGPTGEVRLLMRGTTAHGAERVRN